MLTTMCRRASLCVYACGLYQAEMKVGRGISMYYYFSVVIKSKQLVKKVVFNVVGVVAEECTSSGFTRREEKRAG